eukprot:CAMPEP_0170280060 /NCGR_PEP_ID=MMETSP0116_2-20130129/40041_2 /TAXON_ID=400756 /ORGANISM="Durinskia baltica, Strain CSIRO CS-38" /LENGTH=147 /DNA_ID=CAMNT_0010531385 /DNA_START=207 /DNA_END=651 /DNA_ORIENTATION=-
MISLFRLVDLLLDHPQSHLVIVVLRRRDLAGDGELALLADAILVDFLHLLPDVAGDPIRLVHDEAQLNPGVGHVDALPAGAEERDTLLVSFFSGMVIFERTWPCNGCGARKCDMIPEPKDELGDAGRRGTMAAARRLRIRAGGTCNL